MLPLNLKKTWLLVMQVILTKLVNIDYTQIMFYVFVPLKFINPFKSISLIHTCAEHITICDYVTDKHSFK